MANLAQIMRTLRTMPPLPEVASRVLAIVGDPEFSLDALVAVVRTDPALTARILKLCNSSLFGLREEVRSVGDAVAYIGSRNLVKLVLATCTGSYFADDATSSYADPTQLWRQAVARGTACQALAERSGYGQPATAFTVGILHDIGRLALAQVADDEALQRCAAQLGDPLQHALEVERRTLGMDHATAAGIVAETWGLPLELRRAVRNHHDELLLASDDVLTALLHTAEEIVLGLGIGEEAAERPHAPSPAALRRLALAAGDLEDVRALVTREAEPMAKALNPRAAVSR